MTKPNNPARTGGPRTAKGKQLASSNALKTGAYSSMVVLPGEDQADFDRLLEEFAKDHEPTGATECALVRELAVIYWKKLRLERIEFAQHQLAQSLPITEAEVARVGLEVPQGFGWALAKLESYNAGNMEDLKDDCQFCERLLGGKASYEDFQVLKHDFPELYQRLVSMAQEGRVQDYSDETLRDFKVVDDFDQLVYATEFIGHGIIKGFGEIMNAYEHRDEYREAFKRVHMQRRIDLMANNRLGRPAEELSRAFARTLSELRKQQEWRRGHQIIDVTPVGP